MAAEVQAPSDREAIREAWIESRIAEFQADPVMRDRAIAMILFDTLSIQESVGGALRRLAELGPGGMLKELMRGGLGR